MNNQKCEVVLKMLPRKLKWWEKILQKLHIKDYYVKVGTPEKVDLDYILDNLFEEEDK